jgi:type IV pilus assembly protein PilY1
LEPGDNAICSTFSGTGASGSPYLCKGFGFTGGETYVSLTNSTSTTTFGGKTYYNKYRITYISPPTTTTYYYANSYPGATSGYYYVSQYNYGFSGSQIFNVRVKACDSTVGLENNCKQFGSSYKPTGVIQDNGSQMRFGVTSYFQANDIDNAVLRSKAKYVAPLMYSPSGGVANNARTEWSSTDGTLFSNPDSSDAATATSFIGTTSNTGVINYINKFGSTSHTYKTYDDIGKLYYETLKYLRGTKAPTRDFYNGAKSSNADGFPVINQWDDPVQFSCQKNYIITMGDAHTWCDKRLPGGSYTTVGSSTCNSYTDGNANNHAQDTNSLSGDTGVNVTTATNTIGTLENVSNLSTTQTGAGGASFYMSGLAQWAASQDIRSDFAGKQTVQTYVIDVEENKDCGFNSQFWYAAKYGNPASYDTNGNWLTTNNPWATSLTLPGGACSSRAPTGYSTSGGAVTWPADLLRASDPVGMIASVRSAITQIVAQIGDEAALAQSSGFLDTGTGAYIYRATYNSGGWMGDVQALVINTSGSISSTPAWSASTQLPTASNRNVLTFNDGRQPGGAKETSDAYALRGVAFSSSGFTNLSARQQAWLDTDSTGLVDNYGTDRVSYILGDQSKEAFLPGTTTPNPSANYGWRTRSSRLGDVINSNPVFVGPPSSGYADTTYKTFANANASRTPLVYVGGNDGMLHAFDASYTYDTSGNPQTVSTSSHISGREVFAYVPSAVYGNLSQLMSPTYSHKYYVDGSPTVGDACFSTCTNASQWKTVLIGSLNAGGQGIFALDITDPATSFTGTNVLWEFTDADDADLGFTFSRPIIRKLNNGKWAAIFGNGYNNTYADGSTSSTGRAYLYILYIDGPGAGNSWTLGTNYFKIALKSPSEGTSPTLPLSPPNGLSSAASLDIDFNGTTDYVYAGDRLGNLWKIDLTSSTPSQWKSAFTDSSNNPLPLFTAKDPSGNTQQITTGINIAPTINGRSGYMVMFGTGSWVDTTDPVGPFKTDSLYGIWDTPLIDTSTTPNTTYTTPVASRSNLQQQKVLFYVDTNGNTQDSNGNPYTPTTLVNGQAVYAVYSSCQPYYLQSFSKTSPPSMPSNISDPLCPSSIAIGSGKTGTQRGWVMDLTSESGERVRSSTPQIGDQGAKVTFTTLSPATDPCTGNTIGQEYNLATDTGGSPHSGVYVGGSQGQVKVAAAQIPGYTGTVSITVVLGGTAITGGASDNAINFNATPPTSVATTPTNSISPPTTVCSGSACPNFVPGWGFLMNLQGPTAANSRMVLSCSPPEIGTGLPNCTWKYKYGTFGRLSWRQVTH